MALKPALSRAITRASETFDESGARLLASVAHTLFPHAFLTQAQLARSVDLLAESTARDAGLREAVDSLLRDLPHDFPTLDVAARESALRTVAGSQALAAARRAAMGGIYRDPAFWAQIGYPGPSAPLGGYAGPGLVDIDWLDKEER
ncbi:MAG: hypothetical protein AB7I42_20325 [Bradyrhizobium sp.]|uniref:hypothetical protein n=1 Tax=Bradyrhizobium sp. TaxID=376 RepID=UPI003D0B9C34